MEMTARLFRAQLAPVKKLLVCLPGGSMTRDYFDLGGEDRNTYSFARIMSGLGYDVLIMDHPGIASNPLHEDHGFLMPKMAAGYLANALEKIFSIAGHENTAKIIIGHSMGGMMSVLLQAHHKQFNGLCLFGSSAGGLDWALDENEKTYKNQQDRLESDLQSLTLRKFQMAFPPGLGGPTGHSKTFGGETKQANQYLRNAQAPLYAAGGMMSMIKGSFRREAEAIDIPILFAFGEHDLGIPPQDAPKDFINVASCELIVLDSAGHNSFAFSAINTLVKRVDHWASDIA